MMCPVPKLDKVEQFRGGFEIYKAEQPDILKLLSSLNNLLHDRLQYLVPALGPSS